MCALAIWITVMEVRGAKQPWTVACISSFTAVGVTDRKGHGVVYRAWRVASRDEIMFIEGR